MKKTIVLMLLFLIPMTTQASDPQVTIQIASQVVVAEKTEDGTVREHFKPTKTVVPGSIVQYTLTCSNNSDVKAEGVRVSNPLPNDTFFEKEVNGTDNAQIYFSADKGNVFSDFATLKVKDKDGKIRPARKEDLTHVQWVFTNPLEPSSSVTVSYRVRVK